MAAFALVAPAAASAASGAPGTAAGTTSASGNLPHAVFSANLHAEFAALRGRVTTGPRAGIVPPLGTRAQNSRLAPAACAEPNCNMRYNGGSVQHSPHLYVVFWGPGWSGATATEKYLTSFYAGLGAADDKWSLTTSQYSDGTGHPVFGKSVFVEYGTDTAAPPSEVTPDAIATEATIAVAKFKISDVANAQVIVAAQSGTCFSDGFVGSSCTPVMATYCAWHSSTNGGLSFTNLPYQLDADGNCGENFVNPGSAGIDDGFSIVGGHEYAESVTDPLPGTGYVDDSDNVSGGEIGDKCAWGGELWGTPDPIGDIKLSTGTFAVQSLWSNVTHGCVMSGLLPLSVKALGGQTSALGHAVSVQVHASTSPATALTYTASGLPSGLTINRSSGLIHGTVSGAVKVYSAKVTVAYYASSASFTVKWTVDAVGRVTGTWSKCLDNAGGKTTAGNKIDISTCTGKAPQTITFTPGGQLQVQGGCITGTTRALFEPCSSATNKIWTRTGSEYVNKSNGKCLTDPNNSSANGTALTLATCANKVYQHWSLP